MLSVIKLFRVGAGGRGAEAIRKDKSEVGEVGADYGVLHCGKTGQLSEGFERVRVGDEGGLSLRRLHTGHKNGLISPG